MTNEAAERLRGYLEENGAMEIWSLPTPLTDLDDALAAAKAEGAREERARILERWLNEPDAIAFRAFLESEPQP